MSTTHTAESCPFCDPPKDRVFAQDKLVIALWDGYPVSPGHALIIPRRHMPSLFDTTETEQSALLAMVNLTKAIIDERHRPDGYNIGVNVGAAAGQTVFHLHIHVIPRFVGDVDEPRGGVRHVIPAKANYTLDLEGGSLPARGPPK
ncbi:MAG: HIT family protein [Gammaproteobacteria bacterium]